ncbi:MAG TPA: carbonate dehydratase [Pyrinomonadaceae bacterium]|nr:carbonate dehydratase [Pyrinomonadaceae bacterium]
MKTLKHLFDNNRNWSKKVSEEMPNFFASLAEQQNPEYVWIGCSDSRVSANNIVGLMPGEIFVHRNIANLVVHTDMNCLSVLQFAVEVLQVKHIIVCGHYGCGGVQAALENKRHGLIDNWLRHIQDTANLYESILSEIEDESAKLDKLCELNVIEQVLNVAETTIVQDAWERKQKLRVHGWIYDLKDGIITDLDVHLENRVGTNTLRKRFLYKANQTEAG